MSIDIGNGFVTTNRSDHILINYNNRNTSIMANVPTLPKQENKFTRAYEGFSDLTMTGSQVMHNKTQEIIDSVARFNQALKEAAKNRHIDVTEEEEAHMRTDAIASSLSSVFMHNAANNPTVVDMERQSRK